MKHAHRDDLPPELLQTLEAAFPGMQVVCAGDMPTNASGELPERMKEMLAAIEASHQKSIAYGLCIDCGSEMPGYNIDDDDWQPAEGWRHFTQGEGDETEIVAWQCPACDAAESA
jgi:hypothetical protein